MPSLKSQAKREIQGRFVYNESKHKASDEEKQHNIYSKSTRDTYVQQALKFIDYVKSENASVKTIEEARAYVQPYLQSELEKNKSAWTVRTEAAALAKLYDCKSTELGVKMPVRHRNDITRSRSASDYSKHFSETNNKELVAVCRSTGLRRNELSSLKGSDIEEKGNSLYINVRGSTAKGGRERTVIVFNEDKATLDTAVKYLKTRLTEPDSKVFDKVSKAAPVHSYRAEYAQSLYSHNARSPETLKKEDKYTVKSGSVSRSFDRQAVSIVTKNLGHNRLEVAVNNYLYR